MKFLFVALTAAGLMASATFAQDATPVTPPSRIVSHGDTANHGETATTAAKPSPKKKGKKTAGKKKKKSVSHGDTPQQP